MLSPNSSLNDTRRPVQSWPSSSGNPVAIALSAEGVAAESKWIGPLDLVAAAASGIEAPDACRDGRNDPTTEHQHGTLATLSTVKCLAVSAGGIGFLKIACRAAKVSACMLVVLHVS